MAWIGVRYPRFCPYNVQIQEDGSELEVLGTGKVMGKAMRINITISADPVIQYADDGPAEVVTEFNSGTITNENNDLIASVEAELLGHTLQDGEIIAKADDNPPYCRVGWVESRILNNVRSYVGQVYMRVKYSPPGKDLQTKGQSITFTGATLNGTIMLNADREYERHKDFATLNEAIAYIDNLLNMGGEIPELTVTTVPANDATGVALDADVVATFSNVIDHGSAALFDATTYNPVAATSSFDSTKKILTVSPEENLTASTKYLFVLTGVVDAYNQALEDKAITFTTGAGG